MRTTHLPIVLLLTLLPVPSVGQAVIRPGDPQLAAPAPETDSAVFALVTLSGEGERRVGTVVRHLVRSRASDGAAALVRVQRYPGSAGGESVDSSWVDAKTLAPLRYHARVGPEEQRLAFSPRMVEGSVRTPDSTRSVRHEAAEAFFNAVTDDLVLGALPLREGLGACPSNAVGRAHGACVPQTRNDDES